MTPLSTIRLSRSASLAALLVPLLALLVLAPRAGAQGTVVHDLDRTNQQPQSLKSFGLTKETMREAKPKPAPEVGPAELGKRGPKPLAPASGGKQGDGKPIYLEGQAPTEGPLASKARRKLPKNPKVTSGPVPPAWYKLPPFRSNGKLYMRYGQKFFTCSATVVPSRSHQVILTAGHCIFDKKRGFADDVAFVPGSYRNAGPYGLWLGTRIVTTRQWVKSKSRKNDYAAVKLVSRRGAVGNVVGESGLALNAKTKKQKVLALGYPSNLGGSQVMWACFSRILGRDPFVRRKGGQRPIAMACNMSYGCSGGSWAVRRPNGRFYVNSVSSYFYQGKRYKNLLFGPYLGKKTKRVITKANRG